MDFGKRPYTMHTPVLLGEVMEFLNPREGGVFIDGTINGGGHAREILKRIGTSGTLIGIDRDSSLIEKLDFGKAKNVELVADNYTNMGEIAKSLGVSRVDGIVLDLGFSSFHTDESGRGFSFQKDEALDMRYDVWSGVTAEDLVNRSSEKDLEKIIREYGEERFSRRIAKAICEARKKQKIRTTHELAVIIRKSIPTAHTSNIHPATRTFQALRIAVNRELENIEKGIRNALDILKQDGVLAVISFHSLEDRIVKNTFAEAGRSKDFLILTKKPIVAGEGEIKKNPRARSAKLRAMRKI